MCSPSTVRLTSPACQDGKRVVPESAKIVQNAMAEMLKAKCGDTPDDLPVIDSPAMVNAPRVSSRGVKAPNYVRRVVALGPCATSNIFEKEAVFRS